jgi:hypothetical protein
MTRAGLLARISSYELEQWAALYRIEEEERIADAKAQSSTASAFTEQPSLA